MLSIGNQPERIQALETGAVDAADLSFPADVQATRKGFKVLWDAKKEVSYPSMSVVLRRKSVVDDRDTVIRMVKAHVEAIHFLKTNKEASTKILGKYLKTNDRELLDGSYEIYRDDFISVPYPITQGLQPTYEYVALQRPDIGITNPKSLWMRASSRSWTKVVLSNGCQRASGSRHQSRFGRRRYDPHRRRALFQLRKEHTR